MAAVHFYDVIYGNTAALNEVRTRMKLLNYGVLRNVTFWSLVVHLHAYCIVSGCFVSY